MEKEQKALLELENLIKIRNVEDFNKENVVSIDSKNIKIEDSKIPNTLIWNKK